MLEAILNHIGLSRAMMEAILVYLEPSWGHLRRSNDPRPRPNPGRQGRRAPRRRCGDNTSTGTGDGGASGGGGGGNGDDGDEDGDGGGSKQQAGSMFCDVFGRFSGVFALLGPQGPQEASGCLRRSGRRVHLRPFRVPPRGSPKTRPGQAWGERGLLFRPSM